MGNRKKPADEVAKNRAKANKQNITKRSSIEKLLTKDGASYIKSRHRYKFSKIEEKPVDSIHLDPSIFQGRSVPFAAETVEKIIREGYDITQDPIILWRDENQKKDFVVSGHSRFEAAKRSKLKKIPVKYYIGDKDDAIDYALIESNRSGKQEGIESDIKAYARAKQRGYNKEFLLSIFKEEGYINILRNVSYLDPQGDFIRILSKGDNKEAKSYPYLLRNAVWVGSLRRQNEKLTHKHEKEMFEFLYKSDKGLKIKKDAFFELINKKVEHFNFKSSEPLGLGKVKTFDQIKETDPGIQKYNQMKYNISEWQSERNKKEELRVRALYENNTNKATELKTRINEIELAIERKYKELFVLEKNLKNENNRLKTVSLFG